MRSDRHDVHVRLAGKQSGQIAGIGGQEDAWLSMPRGFGGDQRVDAIVAPRAETEAAGSSRGLFRQGAQSARRASEDAENAIDLRVTSSVTGGDLYEDRGWDDDGAALTDQPA